MPQGRMLGGGNSLNVMVYVRGTPEDYDDWARQGCTGWGWSEVLEVFKRAESKQPLGAAVSWHRRAPAGQRYILSATQQPIDVSEIT